jgi:hypothetical protein
MGGTQSRSRGVSSSPKSNEGNNIGVTIKLPSTDSLSLLLSSSSSGWRRSRREQSLIDVLAREPSFVTWPSSLFPLISSYVALEQHIYIGMSNIGHSPMIPIFRRAVSTFKEKPSSSDDNDMMADSSSGSNTGKGSVRQEWRQLAAIVPGREHSMFTFYDGVLYFLPMREQHSAFIRSLAVEPDWMPTNDFDQHSASVISVWQPVAKLQEDIWSDHFGCSWDHYW